MGRDTGKVIKCSCIPVDVMISVNHSVEPACIGGFV